MTQHADLAAGPLTVNPLRNNTVTFVDPPFMAFDLAILMRKRDQQSSKVNSISSLGGQDKVKYGVIRDGSTLNFFETATVQVYRTMGRKMKGQEDTSLLPSVADAVRRVRASTDSHPFAFIGEQYQLEYHASRKPCDVTVVRGADKVLHGSYHIAVKQSLDADTINKLKTSLQKLKDAGHLDALYKKWWADRAECGEVYSSASVTGGGGGGTAFLVPVLLTALLGRLFGDQQQ